MLQGLFQFHFDFVVTFLCRNYVKGLVNGHMENESKFINFKKYDVYESGCDNFDELVHVDNKNTVVSATLNRENYAAFNWVMLLQIIQQHSLGST